MISRSWEKRRGFRKVGDTLFSLLMISHCRGVIEDGELFFQPARTPREIDDDSGGGAGTRGVYPG